jgi:hypothetical protein
MARSGLASLARARRQRPCWLADRPSIDIIARDCGAGYRQAAAEGRPGPTPQGPEMSRAFPLRPSSAIPE